MACPASPNPISLADIQTEFGGASPTGLDEYYKGGTYVAVTDNAPNVPASGPISVANFHGASKNNGITVTGMSAGGSCIGLVHCTIDAATATATPTSGTGPYIYSWRYVSGYSLSHTATNASSITFSTGMTFPLYGESTKDAVWRCTVTDSLGASGFVEVNVSMYGSSNANPPVV